MSTAANAFYTWGEVGARPSLGMRPKYCKKYHIVAAIDIERMLIQLVKRVCDRWRWGKRWKLVPGWFRSFALQNMSCLVLSCVVTQITIVFCILYVLLHFLANLDRLPYCTLSCLVISRLGCSVSLTDKKYFLSLFFITNCPVIIILWWPLPRPENIYVSTE